MIMMVMIVIIMMIMMIMLMMMLMMMMMMMMILLMEEILHQFIGSLSHYFQGFLEPRWLFRIPSTVVLLAKAYQKIVRQVWVHP